MATILFAYEFGAGLGHLSILTTVAKRFAGQHRLVFAVPDLPLATLHLSRTLGVGITIHQAPKWSGVEHRINERGTFCHTLAETLYLFAFDDQERLRFSSEMWLSIIKTERPDVVVVDSAPTARLALETRIPMVVVGTGYTVLPEKRVLPALRPWQQDVPPHSRSVEARICASVNDCRSALKGNCVEYLGDLFRGDATYVSTLPEFDPYAAFRGCDPYAPFGIPAFSPGTSFKLRTGHSVFAYLPSVHPAAFPVIKALNEREEPSRLFISGVSPDRVAQLCRRHVRVHSVPADFSVILPECKVIIHHAGLGTTLAAMAAGTAQITLPTMVENQITGLGLQKSGSSINLQTPPVPDAEDIKSSILLLMKNDSFEVASLGGARRVAELRDLNPLDRIVHSVIAHLA